MLCVMYYIYGEGRDDNDNGIYSSYNWIDDQLVNKLNILINWTNSHKYLYWNFF